MDLALRQGRHSRVLQLIEQAKEYYTAQDLREVAHACMAMPCCAHPPSAKAALSAALQRMRLEDEPSCMDQHHTP